MTLNKFAALAFLAMNGPALVGAQELFTCNTNDNPRWPDCDAIFAAIDWTTGTLPDDPPPIEPGQCAKWTADDYPRCLIQACNYRDVPQPNNVFNGPGFYQIIKSNCEGESAGGKAPTDGQSTAIIVSNNPDQPPAPPSRIKRAASGGPIRQDITIAESQELLERAKQALEKSNTLNQRQDPGAWTTIGLSSNVRTNQRDQGAPVVSPGVAQSYETSEGFSASISSTVSLEAGFFDIFSASVSLTVGLEYTNTWSETLTFTPGDKCESDQEGILYMYPLFDKYTGFYANTPDKVDEWLIPVNGDRVNYAFDVECLG